MDKWISSHRNPYGIHVESMRHHRGILAYSCGIWLVFLLASLAPPFAYSSIPSPLLPSMALAIERRARNEQTLSSGVTSPPSTKDATSPCNAIPSSLCELYMTIQVALTSNSLRKAPRAVSHHRFRHWETPVVVESATVCECGCAWGRECERCERTNGVVCRGVKLFVLS